MAHLRFRKSQGPDFGTDFRQRAYEKGAMGGYHGYGESGVLSPPVPQRRVLRRSHEQQFHTAPPHQPQRQYSEEEPLDYQHYHQHQQRATVQEEAQQFPYYEPAQQVHQRPPPPRVQFKTNIHQPSDRGTRPARGRRGGMRVVRQTHNHPPPHKTPPQQHQQQPSHQMYQPASPAVPVTDFFFPEPQQQTMTTQDIAEREMKRTPYHYGGETMGSRRVNGGRGAHRQMEGAWDDAPQAQRPNEANPQMKVFSALTGVFHDNEHVRARNEAPVYSDL